jgi:hypothetical protein
MDCVGVFRQVGEGERERGIDAAKEGKKNLP